MHTSQNSCIKLQNLYQSLLSCFSCLWSALLFDVLLCLPMRTSCRWNLLTHTSSLLVIVFAAVGVSLSFLPLASLSIYYECWHRCLRPSLLSLSYISCLIAVVVHIAVITLIAAIAISVFFCLYCLCICYMRSALIRRVIH